ncbi:hypothetical protein Tco_1123931 [Tanacetum coccineum]|uniref:Uncharacterized protein n=1 Tax=Tanacetum coccineum TaxID=301880 RepID=A0ABQ5J5B8_9ASTR
MSTCKKYLYSANHDECVLEYLSKLNPRASAQIKDAKSHNTTKRYVPVEKSSASKKPDRQIPTGHRFSNKKTTTVPEKKRSPKSCLRWQPTGTSFNGQKQQRIDITADALYNEKQENLRGLVLHQMTSDHNRSELGIHDHSNEPSSSKLVPKVVPLAVKTATSRQELELLFHHHIAMPRTTVRKSILMIQPEPEDLPKDNPIVRNSSLRQHGPSGCQCTTLPQPFGFLSTELVLICHEIHTLSIDISLRIVDIEKVQKFPPAIEY